MNVLSLFDGMSCGQIALNRAGIHYDNYFASEIDKYTIQVTQGTNYQVSTILVIHNGTTTNMTEYGVLETNGSLATFTSDISGGNVRLLVTMGSATSATINLDKAIIVI